MQFKLNLQDEIFEIKVSGTANFEGFSELYKKTVEHEQWKQGGLIIADYSELHAEGLSINDIKAIAALSQQYRQRFGYAKYAIVVGREVEYGLARMWEAYLGADAWDVSQKLFRSKDEALAWLTKTDVFE